MIIRFALLFSMVFGQSVFAKTIQPRDCKFFDAESAAEDLNSDAASAFAKPFDLAGNRTLAVQVTWSSIEGSVDGSIKIQTANTGTVPGASDWDDLPSATFNMSGADGTDVIRVTDLTDKWARVVYTDNSITGGSLTGYCHAK
jgi:hypothetical protein